MIVIAAIFQIAASSSLQATATFPVLLPPTVADAIRTTSSFEAAIGENRYAVRRVQTLDATKGRTVIVLDFGSTSPEMHPCLLAETEVALSRLPHNTALQVISAGTAPSLTASANFGPGERYEIYGGGTLPELTHACGASGGRVWGNHFREWLFARFRSIYTFGALSYNFDSHDAPVLVFWLSETFDWFDARGSPSCAWVVSPNFTCHQEFENLGHQEIERISKAGITVFPIVFGQHRRGVLLKPPAYQVTAANYMARVMGGFVTEVSGSVGDTLVAAFEMTRKAALLSLEGPITVDGKHPPQPKTLSVMDTSKSPPVIWRRPIVVSGRENVLTPLETPLTRLVWPSGNLRMDFGCQTPGRSPGPSLRLWLPPEVFSAPPGRVEIYVEYLNDGGLAKQRLTEPRPSKASESLCIPLAHAREGTNFRLVVFDRAAGWFGARNGALVSPSHWPHDSRQ